MPRELLFVLLRLLVFVVLQGVVYAAAGGVLMSDMANAAGESSGEAGVMFLLLMAVQGAAIATLIAGAAPDRLGNAVLIFVAAFGVGTVSTQIDTAIFLEDAGTSFLINVVILGAVTALSAAVIGVFTFKAGWLRPGVTIPLPHTPWGWIAAAMLIAAAHLIVYFTLGYWLVWVHDGARAFYDGGELAGFFAHLKALAEETAWLFPVQFLRGLIFAGIAIMIFRALSLPRWGRMLAAALFFFAYFAAPLIVPNPFMPEEIRRLHFVETGVTSVLMAIIAGAFLRPFGSKGLQFQKIR